MSIKRVNIKGGDTRWEVYSPINGRSSSRMRRRFSTKKEAEDFLAQFRSQRLSVPSSSTVKSLEEVEFKDEAQYWLGVRGPRFSPGHQMSAKLIMNKFVEEFGNWKLHRFNPITLTQIQSRLMEQGLSSATVNRKMSMILAVLNLSVKHRRIPLNPSTGFEKLREVREEVKFWEHKEALSFLEFASRTYPLGSKNRWIYVVYLLALNTGLRSGEIWGLQPQDIVENDEVIFVRRKFDQAIRDYGPPKGKKPRRVPCNEALRRELLMHIESMKTQPSNPVFVGSCGRPRDHRSFVKRRFESDLRHWGGRFIRFHDLRHTATTLMIKDGIDLKTVQEICGHQDVSTTMGYAHLVKSSIQDVARRFQLSATESPQLRLVSN
jgi:integrase